ncbi:MAG: AlpA family phage regulatory protein [Methylovulum sp.]|nr:MAG: AlpA family phage regulatory protein [Methylovulum sp.]
MATKQQFMKLKEVAEATKLSRSSIYLGVKNGTFPKPLKLSERRIAFRMDDIDSWMNSRREV